MWPAIIGAGISAAGSLAGGLIGSGAQQAMNAQNMAFGREQLEWQKTLAQQGIRMRVADAKAAGIHPLYALGNPGMSSAPISVSGVADTSMGHALSNMGQDISRAFQAVSTREERERDRQTQLALQANTLQKSELENQLIQSQIWRNYNSVGPGLPANVGPQSGAGPIIPGQNVFEVKPAEVVGSQGPTGSSPVAAGNANPIIQFAHTGSGLAPMPAPITGMDDLDAGSVGAVALGIHGYARPYFGDRSAPRPTMEQMAKAFPGATGMEFRGWQWKPLYGGDYEKFGAAGTRRFAENVGRWFYRNQGR